MERKGKRYRKRAHCKEKGLWNTSVESSGPPFFIVDVGPHSFLVFQILVLDR